MILSLYIQLSNAVAHHILQNFAKLSLNSTQLKLKLRLRLALYPVSDTPPSHPATRRRSRKMEANLINLNLANLT